MNKEPRRCFALFCFLRACLLWTSQYTTHTTGCAVVSLVGTEDLLLLSIAVVARASTRLTHQNYRARPSVISQLFLASLLHTHVRINDIDICKYLLLDNIHKCIRNVELPLWRVPSIYHWLLYVEFCMVQSMHPKGPRLLAPHILFIETIDAPTEHAAAIHVCMLHERR